MLNSSRWRQSCDAVRPHRSLGLGYNPRNLGTRCPFNDANGELLCP